MNRHAVLTDDTVDDVALLAALEAAGIDAQAKPLHLQRAAKVAADIIAEYPADQIEHARDTLIRWIDEALDTADDARQQRIIDSIEKLQRDHGELVTWRCPGGYIALDVPTAFVTSISRAYGAKRDIELRQLTGLLLPQLERIAPSIMQGVLGGEYVGNRGDYERLVAIACRDLIAG
ncbi:hypothetical protein [Halomonas sp. LC1]|uniref:hypothetical protein n=1 Tax=Halomonas sp. LC1 TaxID=3043733 RepID=UPI00255495BB|nr:hypothetical protein [Halomonas sp. LC1]MDK9689191.1 hypothetical protein [Halomonas sp. LC1]